MRTAALIYGCLVLAISPAIAVIENVLAGHWPCDHTLGSQPIVVDGGWV